MRPRPLQRRTKRPWRRSNDHHARDFRPVGSLRPHVSPTDGGSAVGKKPEFAARLVWSSLSSSSDTFVKVKIQFPSPRLGKEKT